MSKEDIEAKRYLMEFLKRNSFESTIRSLKEKSISQGSLSLTLEQESLLPLLAANFQTLSPEDVEEEYSALVDWVQSSVLPAKLDLLPLLFPVFVGLLLDYFVWFSPNYSKFFSRFSGLFPKDSKGLRALEIASGMPSVLQTTNGRILAPQEKWCIQSGGTAEVLLMDFLISRYRLSEDISPSSIHSIIPIVLSHYVSFTPNTPSGFAAVREMYDAKLWEDLLWYPVFNCYEDITINLLRERDFKEKMLVKRIKRRKRDWKRYVPEMRGLRVNPTLKHPFLPSHIQNERIRELTTAKKLTRKGVERESSKTRESNPTSLEGVVEPSSFSEEVSILDFHCDLGMEGEGPSCVGFQEASRVAVFGMDDGSLRGVRLDPEKSCKTLRACHHGTVTSVSFDTVHSDFFISSSVSGEVLMHEAINWNLVERFESFQGNAVWSTDYSPFGFYFACGVDDSTCRLMSTDRPRKPLRMFLHKAKGFGGTVVKFHPNSSMVASAHGSEIVLWDLAERTPVRAFYSKYGSDVTSLQFSRDGRYVLSGDHNGGINVWDLAAGREALVSSNIPKEKEENAKGTQISGISLSQLEGGCLATVEVGGTVKLWDFGKILNNRWKKDRAFRLERGRILNASFNLRNTLVLGTGPSQN